MQLTDILAPECVRVIGSMTSKKRLFQELSEIAGSTWSLAPGDIFDALQDRESLGPTGVGHGVALPHARISDIENIRGIFVRLERPVDFDSIDRQPVDLIFALLAPQEAGVDHLKALALVSRTLRNQALCTKLRANTDPVALYAILTESKSTQAA